MAKGKSISELSEELTQTRNKLVKDNISNWSEHPDYKKAYSKWCEAVDEAHEEKYGELLRARAVPDSDTEIKEIGVKIHELQNKIGRAYFMKALPKTPPYGYPQSPTDSEGDNSLTDNERLSLFKTWELLHKQKDTKIDEWYYELITERSIYFKGAFERLSKISYMFGGIQNLLSFLRKIYAKTKYDMWIQPNSDTEYWFKSYCEINLEEFSGFEKWIACRLLADTYITTPDGLRLRKRLLKEAAEKLPHYNIQYVDVYDSKNRWFVWDVNPPYSAGTSPDNLPDIYTSINNPNKEQNRTPIKFAIALHLIFEKCNIEDTPSTARAKFIEWLTGRNYKNIYDCYRERLGKDGALTRSNDVEFVLNEFRKAGLTSLIAMWEQLQNIRP